METAAGYELVFRLLALLLGAAVGSFLNVCIYRLPHGMSVNQPRRSFCPACKAPIPWYQNLPLLSWLWLGGKCAQCGSRISFRYFAVELVTSLLFLIIWIAFPWQAAIAYWVLASLLIVATFIDFEHFIIPDEITVGGTVCGVLAAFLVPSLMDQSSSWRALFWSLGSAAFGYLLLWIVLEGGKKVFGKKRVRLSKPTPFSWMRHGDDADFVVGDEKALWSEYFARESDLMLMRCSEAQVDDRSFSHCILQLHYNVLTIQDETFRLDELDRFTGMVEELQIPREAMGRGDLKFIAAIGAFLGWRGVLCSIFAGSLIGSVVGLTSLLFKQRAWSAKIPFGPYLALGALTWIFFGSSLVSWYLDLLTP